MARPSKQIAKRKPITKAQALKAVKALSKKKPVKVEKKISLKEIHSVIKGNNKRLDSLQEVITQLWNQVNTMQNKMDNMAVFHFQVKDKERNTVSVPEVTETMEIIVDEDTEGAEDFARDFNV